MGRSSLLALAWAARLSGRRRAVDGYAAGVAAGGLDRRRLARTATAGRALILNFHAVEPPGTHPVPALDPRVLDDLLRWLRRRARVVTLAELRQEPSAGVPLVVLSFDDGYRDFLEYVMPVLDRHGVRANQNVVPSCAEQGRPPWNVALLDALATVEPARLAQAAASCAAGPSPALAFASPWRFAELWVSGLKRLDRAHREQAISELSQRLPELAEATPRPMLDVEEIRAVSVLHEIGAHSFEHESMAAQSDDYLSDDLDRCAAWFERHGLPLSDYAFPNGSYRPEQLEIVLSRGLRALLVGERPADRGADALHRITMFGRSSLELRARIARAAGR